MLISLVWFDGFRCVLDTGRPAKPPQPGLNCFLWELKKGLVFSYIWCFENNQFEVKTHMVFSAAARKWFDCVNIDWYLE